jgi:hypothetical protein
MRYCATWVLAFTSVLAIESAAYARMTAPPPRAWVVESVEDSEAGVDILVIDSSLSRRGSYSDGDPADSVVGVAPVHLCHVSHHPRDGLRPEQHACPLFVARAQPAGASPVRRHRRS